VSAIIDITGIRKKKPGKSWILLPGSFSLAFGSRRLRESFADGFVFASDLPNRSSSDKINRNYGDYG
jgi:hypothetical protein